jgi:RHS repeat-associated protein
MAGGRNKRRAHRDILSEPRFSSVGNVTAATGSLTNTLRYTGRELDGETNLYSYRARYFSSIAGRFISEDPLLFGGDDTNFYRYVHNDTIDLTDPTGLCPENRFWNCAKGYYGIGTAGTRFVTLAAAAPIPKSWFGLPSALRSGSFTNLLSYLSLGSGTAASGANLMRLGGRIAGPVGAASALIDAAALAMCTADYVPGFLYTIAKYDPL